MASENSSAARDDVSVVLSEECHTHQGGYGADRSVSAAPYLSRSKSCRHRGRGRRLSEQL